MQDVLVTGGAGFIGSHTAERFVMKGWRVGIIDNFEPFYPEAWKRWNLKEVQKAGPLALFECDIRHRVALSDVFRQFRPSTVIHFAARAGVQASIEQPLLSEQINVAGTCRLLEVCREHRVTSLVFASSSSVYGENTRIPFREDDCCARPSSPYAASKLAGESFCYTYSHLYNLTVACLRLFTVYGPRQRPDLAIHKFTKLIEAGSEIPMFGDDFNGRDYTYIDDVVDGILAAVDWCSRSKAAGGRYGIFNLGNSRPVKLNELIAAMEAATGKTAICKQLPPRPGDMKLTWADISKARHTLGYRPRTTLQEGLARFVNWYRSFAHVR